MTRDQLLALRPAPPEAVALPNGQGTAYVRAMNGAQRDAYEADHAARPEGQQMQNFRARLLAYTLCDESGCLIFTPADVEQIGQMDGTITTALFAAAARLNGLDRAAAEAAQKN